MKRFLFSMLLCSVLFYSCSKSNEAELGSGSDCNTANMSFANDIKPILQSNCYSCHSNANFEVSGIKLEEYHDVKHHTDDGDLMGTITHASGFPAMPEGGAKLPDCTIKKIKAWVDAGALNN